MRVKGAGQLSALTPGSPNKKSASSRHAQNHDGMASETQQLAASTNANATLPPPLLPHPTYPHPLTLLSLARTPQPTTDYPHLSSLPSRVLAFLSSLFPSFALTSLSNPADLVAGQSRCVRAAATSASSGAALHAQTLLLGGPAHLPSSPSQQNGSVRIQIIDEAGNSTIVTCPSANTTMREIMTYYTQKNNACLSLSPSSSSTSPSLSQSLYIFRFRGVRITKDKATLASLGITPPAASADAIPLNCTDYPPLPQLHVEVDAEQLYLQLRGEMLRERKLAVERLSAAEHARDEQERSWKEKMDELEEKEAELNKAKQRLEAVSNEKSRLYAAVESNKRSVTEQTEKIQQLQQEKFDKEGSASERAEQKRLEKLRNGLRNELDALSVERRELDAKIAKVEKEQSTLEREIRTVEDKSAGMDSEISQFACFAPPELYAEMQATDAETAESQMATSLAAHPNFQPLTTLYSTLESLEKQQAELVIARKKVEFILGEISHKRTEVAALTKKVQQAQAAMDATTEPNAVNAASTSSSHKSDPSHSLATLRSRLLHLERETRDLVRWRGIARHLELESKELTRWKMLAKASINRERAQEREAKDKVHWRTRARAFEMEMRQLRAWRRTVMSGGGSAAAAALASNSGVPADPAASPSDFYTANPSAATLSNITYDTPPSMDGEVDGSERVEPDAHSLQLAEAQEAAMAHSQHSDSSLHHASDGSSSARHRHGRDRMTDELAAAEEEEERLMQNVRRPDSSISNSSSGSRRGSTSSSPSSHLTDGDADEELLRLGEALVRRNQHLHQHRLILRYQHQQQQQLAAIQQHQALQAVMQQRESMEHQQQQQHHQSLEHMHAYNSGKAGMLQASAPVFTPRFPGVETVGGVVSSPPSHYTKLDAAALSATQSAVWPSPNATTSDSLDSHMYRWSLGDGEDGHMNGVLSDAQSRVRDRSFSNPTALPTHLHAHSHSAALPPSYPHSNLLSSASIAATGLSTASTIDGPSTSPAAASSASSSSSSPSPGSSLLVGMGDPFTSFRGQSHLTIIDDDSNVNGMRQRESVGVSVSSVGLDGSSAASSLASSSAFHVLDGFSTGAHAHPSMSATAPVGVSALSADVHEYNKHVDGSGGSNDLDGSSFPLSVRAASSATTAGAASGPVSRGVSRSPSPTQPTLPTSTRSNATGALFSANSNTILSPIFNVASHHHHQADNSNVHGSTNSSQQHEE